MTGTARYVLLRGADPGLAGIPCHSCRAPSFPGAVFVGADLETHGRGVAGFLCPACSRTAAPTLAAVAEAVNVLLALAPDLDPAQHGAVTGALAEITASLPAPVPATDERNSTHGL